jgi:hypothetical protein
VHGFGTRLDAKLMSGDLPRNARHVKGLPCEGIMIGAYEVDERAFLFGWKLGPDPHSLGWVVRVDADRLGVLGRAKGAG